MLLKARLAMDSSINAMSQQQIVNSIRLSSKNLICHIHKEKTSNQISDVFSIGDNEYKGLF